MIETTNELKEELLVGFGDVIDRIVCTTVGQAPLSRRGRGGPSRNRYRWMKVYDETRQRFDRPLTLLAAEKLMENVGESDYVLILTNSHEMDGPPGAAALARALILGFLAIPVIVVNYEENTKSERCIHQTLIGMGLNPVIDSKQLFEGNMSTKTVLIRNWPARSIKGAIEESRKILDEFEPKAIVTVETPSCNKKGVRHGALGESRNPKGDPEEEIVRWNELMELANKRGILTIATGDNGNEAGFGTIEDICRKYHNFGANCGCPCGGGIVSAAKADIVIPGQSSNWASYGIEACLARILQKPEVMHNEYIENRMLLNCADTGTPDGTTAWCTPTIDGTSHESCIYTVGQLRHTVIMSFVETYREPRPKPRK